MRAMIYGYARVSDPKTQDLQGQIATLKKNGCEAVYSEKATSRKWNRPEFQKVLELLKPGDTLKIWRLDRAVSNVEQLEQLLKHLEARQTALVSLTEHFDTSNAFGRAILQLLGVLNQLRLDVIQENTLNGLEGARERGVKLGRPRALSEVQEAAVVRMVLEEGKSKAEVGRLFGVDASIITRTLYRRQAI